MVLSSCQHSGCSGKGCSVKKSKCSKCADGKKCKKGKAKDAVSLIVPVNNSQVKGWVSFQKKSKKEVLVKAEISGLKPNKKHGFHIHQYGDCRNNAKDAGSHFNPYKEKHGAPEDAKKHAGDLGNLKAGKSGRAFYQKTVKMCLKSLAGRSVIVHAETDDLKSQPTGKAGAYIGCGVIGMIPSEYKPPVKAKAPAEKKSEAEDTKSFIKPASAKKAPAVKAPAVSEPEEEAKNTESFKKN